MWLNQDSLARSFTHVASTPKVHIHIYPPISISKATQKHTTPDPRENSQKHSPIFVFSCELNARVILVTTTCYIISRGEYSKKKRKRYEEIKRGKCPERRKK